MEKIFDVNGFSLSDTLKCGQFFRFRENTDGSFTVTVEDKRIRLSQSGSKVMAESSYENDLSWVNSYLGLDEDYESINRILSQDSTLSEIISNCGCIRIMKQPFWETLESFIISQNNNIPRIQGIIERFCEKFGRDMGEFHAFPSPDVVASLSPDDLSDLRCGYRAPYLIDAAQKYLEGVLDETSLRTLPLDESRNILLKVKGVGPKVADCTLLFGLYRLEAFPRDVWIKRAMASLFPEGLPECASEYAGIAQQYIFHYARNMGMLKDK